MLKNTASNLTFSPHILLTETAEEWIRLGKRIHGGFGSYIALGIRMGLEAMHSLGAQPRGLDITYQAGSHVCSSCIVDGLMIATVATPGQNSLRVLDGKSDRSEHSLVWVKHKRTTQCLHYVIPQSAYALLNAWNAELTESDRFDAVMSAFRQSLFWLVTP